MKTVELDIRIKVNVSDDAKYVTVDKNGIICEHLNTPKPIDRHMSKIWIDEWALTDGKVIRNRYSVVNWRETLTEVK